ncbi:hypothetical protein CRUP_029649 [Coryphaenoides rupestris]|nr:hypothetical protein CRUP_029649 [Coryphaenoides rupestris]
MTNRSHKRSTRTFVPCFSWNPLSQVIWTQVEETASISCDINSQCPSVSQITSWFLFNESGHHKLDLLQTSKYVLQEITLIWHILLWTLFALLTIYNLSIMIIIYRRKTNAHLKPCAKPKESNSSSRLHFRSVVEELYNKRNLRNNEDDKDGSEGQPRKDEAARSKPSNEDLYQNL